MNADKHSDDFKADDRRTSATFTDAAPSPVCLLSSPSSLLNASPEHSIFSTTTAEDGEQENYRKTKQQNGRKPAGLRLGFETTMWPKLSETVKGKMKLGAKIIRKGGRENIFKEVFGEIDGEKLLKASQCYLSTTAGPIAGILFISTQKLAFCSDRSITLPSSNGNGDLMQMTYKVLIPINKIKDAKESENVENPAQKYIHIITNDNFEFWFMGFVRYEKAFHNLRKALPFVAK